MFRTIVLLNYQKRRARKSQSASCLAAFNHLVLYISIIKVVSGGRTTATLHTQASKHSSALGNYHQALEDERLWK